MSSCCLPSNSVSKTPLECLDFRIVRASSYRDLKYRATGAPVSSVAHKFAKKPVIVACMPKSGSTWLTQALRAVTGYDDVQVSSHWAIQEIDPATMARYQGRGLVGHIHLIASPHTIELLNHYQARVIILTRKLPDVIVSVREFLYAPENINQLRRDGVLQSSFYMINRKFYDLSEQEQYDYLRSHCPCRGMPLQIFLCDAHQLLRSLFCTRLEERFTRAQIEQMLMHADFSGFEQIRFSDLPPYWCAVGLKSSRGRPD